MKTPTSVLVILDKPKHEQSALTEAKTLLSKYPDAHVRLVSFVWHAMAEQKNVFDAHQRRAMKKEIVRTREVWLRDLILDEGLSAASISIEVVWTEDIAGWVEANAETTDLVIKSVHKTKTLLHTPLDWELIRSCPPPLLMVGGWKGKRRKKKAKAEGKEGDDGKKDTDEKKEKEVEKDVEVVADDEGGDVEQIADAT